MLMHAYLYLIPMSLGDIAMTTGEWAGAEMCYAQTTGFLLGKANLDDGPGFANYSYYDSSITASPIHGGVPNVYSNGNRPVHLRSPATGLPARSGSPLHLP